MQENHVASPTAPSVIQAVARSLTCRYGDFSHGNKANPLNELLYIMCSVQTTRANYERTYSRLKQGFPTAQSLREAAAEDIAKVIADGGLSMQKAMKIKVLLEQITNDFGRPTLAPLRHMTDSQCERYLLSLYGVGKKTARCIMMYSLGRQVFPVDTHCWRVSRRLGWVRRTRPDGSCSPSDMDRLQAKIPSALRYCLHVNMISLGREFCSSATPKCSQCPISTFCKQVGVKAGGRR